MKIFQRKGDSTAPCGVDRESDFLACPPPKETCIDRFER